MKASFACKYLHSLDFTDWFTQRSSIYHTRFDQTTSLIVPSILNKHSEQCIIHTGPKIWNELILDVREQTYDFFQNTVKKNLLARQSS